MSTIQEGSKKTAIIVTFIIFLIGIATGGYIYYVSRQNQNLAVAVNFISHINEGRCSDAYELLSADEQNRVGLVDTWQVWCTSVGEDATLETSPRSISTSDNTISAQYNIPEHVEILSITVDKTNRKIEKFAIID